MMGVEKENQVERMHNFRLQFVILVRHRKEHVEEVGGVFVGGLGIDERQTKRLAMRECRERARQP